MMEKNKTNQEIVKEVFVNFLNSCLQTQEGLVKLGSAISDVMALRDMYFQGTCFASALRSFLFGGIPE